jgi:hypothetical protein
MAAQKQPIFAYSRRYRGFGLLQVRSEDGLQRLPFFSGFRSSAASD